MENFNSVPTVNYRGNYPGQQNYSGVVFDEEYDSSDSEISFSTPDSVVLTRGKIQGVTKTVNEKDREKAKRYYIQSTLEVNIDNQHIVENIDIYREKIFPFQLTPNISLVGLEQQSYKGTKIFEIWKRLSNSEPSIIGIVRGKGTVYTIPETVDLILYICFSFGFIITVMLFDSSGNVKHTIYNMLSNQIFDFQSSLASDCLGLPDKNGVTGYSSLYSKRFKDYITAANKNYFDSIKNDVIFPCGKGTINDVATLADYLRWLALILFPSFVNFRGSINSPLTSQVRILTQFNNGTESELTLDKNGAKLIGNKMYIYPYDTETALHFFDEVIEMNYFNKSEVATVSTSFFAYNPFIGIKTSVKIDIESSFITGYYNSNLEVKSVLLKTNSYSYIFLFLALASGFMGLLRLFTHKDVIKSPLKTIKSSINRVFALLSSILLIIAVVTYLTIFIPINWFWSTDTSLEYSKLSVINDTSKLDSNFSEQNIHFQYLVLCNFIFRISGSTSLIFTLWEFFWFLSVKISRKHATSITVVVKKVTFPILSVAAMLIVFLVAYGLIGIILLGEFTSMYSSLSSTIFYMLLVITGRSEEIWYILPESELNTGIFFVPLVCLFGIIFPSYIYAFFCHVYNSTIDTVEWCWENCSRDDKIKFTSSPWYIEENLLYERESKESGQVNTEINGANNVGKDYGENNLIKEGNDQMNDLLFVRDRYSEFMTQSTFFERLYEKIFSRNKLSVKQKKEIEINKFDSYEQTRRIARSNLKNNQSIKSFDKLSANDSGIRCNTNNLSAGGRPCDTLVTRSIHEYYQSIFNSGKTIFSNPGTISTPIKSMATTSQQLMYRMVGTMENSVDMTQSLISKSRDSEYSDSIGLNDQNGLPLLVGNVMASSPCPNMENLLTFTEKVNRIGESVWFGILLAFIFILIIVSNILEYRGKMISGQINSISWNQFHTDININIMKPIYSTGEVDSFNISSPTKFISIPVKLNFDNSETPNEIAYWISMSTSKLIFNSTPEFQYKIIFPEIKAGTKEPNIIFNQNILSGDQTNIGISLRAVSVSNNRSAEQFENSQLHIQTKM
ncbi:putative integral membrane protein [Cryptosporidium felis]|nr:putative integral membrane protein [Cryptosporidium felis]